MLSTKTNRLRLQSNEKGHVAVAKVLIQTVRACCRYRHQAPLHHAAMCENVDVAKVLIQNGADVNVVNKDNYTPLHNAL